MAMTRTMVENKVRGSGFKDACNLSMSGSTLTLLCRLVLYGHSLKVFSCYKGWLPINWSRMHPHSKWTTGVADGWWAHIYCIVGKFRWYKICRVAIQAFRKIFVVLNFAWALKQDHTNCAISIEEFMPPELSTKATKFCTMRKFPAIRYVQICPLRLTLVGVRLSRHHVGSQALIYHNTFLYSRVLNSTIANSAEHLCTAQVWSLSLSVDVDNIGCAHTSCTCLFVDNIGCAHTCTYMYFLYPF